MAGFKVVSPSYCRAEIASTHKHVRDVTYCIPESQWAEYREYHPAKRLEVHPDHIKGIWHKRQWMIQKWPDSFQIDDDVLAIIRCYRTQADPRPRRLTVDDATDMILTLRDTARKMGLYLYGCGRALNPMHYNQFRPIRFGPFAVQGIGILPGSGLVLPNGGFIDKMGGEDAYISLWNLWKYRRIFLDQRFGIHCRPPNYHGGCSTWRGDSGESRCVKFLRECFGAAVTVKFNKETGQPYARFAIPFRV